MFKLFRKLRQNLLNQGNNNDYLKYALGEIALVVIGILIALQIDNWNEDRKFDSEVADVLIEIRSNLISDSLMLYETHKVRKEDINIQSRVIKALESGDIPYDSLNNHLGRVMIARRIVLFDNGYELMKKFGLERLGNADLRSKLAKYYIDSVNDIYGNTKDDEIEFINILLPYIRINFLDWDWGKFGQPANYEKLKSDQYFLTSLRINIRNCQGTLKSYQNGLVNIRQILPLLDEAILSYK